MNQFAVCGNADPVSRTVIPYWLIVQSDLIDATGTRVVLPLVSEERVVMPMRGLMPELVVAGKRHYADAMQITHVPLGMLGKPITDAAEHRHAILAAIDMLTHGI